jgi:hypothetical protein
LLVVWDRLAKERLDVMHEDGASSGRDPTQTGGWRQPARQRCVLDEGTRYAQILCARARGEDRRERWTLLIIRELLLGPARFGDPVARRNDVGLALLTGQLNAFIDNGLVRRARLPCPSTPGLRAH